MSLQKEGKFKKAIGFTNKAIKLLLAVSIAATGFYAFPYIQNKISQDKINATYEQALGSEDQEDLEYNKALLKLKETNEDIQGILTGDVFTSTLPVVQGEDNDYYLSHSVDGTENICGSIEIATENDATAIDNNKVTYLFGHNMKDGSMFGEVNQKCLDQEYMDKHSTLSYSDASGEYNLTFVYAKTISADYMDNINFKSNKEFEKYFENEQENAVTTGEEINADDKLVCLYTCNGDHTYQTRTGAYYKVTKTKSYDASKIINAENGKSL